MIAHTMLCALGDLVDDIVVRTGPINVASDTDAVITHRQGGSAANVAVAAAQLTGSARFLGQVGDDPTGAQLLAGLATGGVDVACVARAGRTGTIVVLVDGQGERTMLVDQGSARQLEHPRPEWLDGIGVLHIPFYALVGGPIAATAATLAGWAYQRTIPVSVDLSSVSVLEQMGQDEIDRWLTVLAPSVVFANADEADVALAHADVAEAVTFVKRGGEPALVFAPGARPLAIAPEPLDRVVDTTGAGDAFAAGVLCAGGWHADPAAACRAGHAAAAALLRSR